MAIFGIFTFGIRPQYLDKLIRDINKDQNQFRVKFIEEYNFDPASLPKLNDGSRFHKIEDEVLKIAENILRTSNEKFDYIIGLTPMP